MRTEDKAGQEGQRDSSEDTLAGGAEDSRNFWFSSSCPLALPRSCERGHGHTTQHMGSQLDCTSPQFLPQILEKSARAAARVSIARVQLGYTGVLLSVSLKLPPTNPQ